MSNNIKLIITITTIVFLLSIIKYMIQLDTPSSNTVEQQSVINTDSVEDFEFSMRQITSRITPEQKTQFTTIIANHLIQLSMKNHCDQNKTWQQFTDEMNGKTAEAILASYSSIYTKQNSLSVDMKASKEACQGTVELLTFDMKKNRLAVFSINSSK